MDESKEYTIVVKGIAKRTIKNRVDDFCEGKEYTFVKLEYPSVEEAKKYAWYHLDDEGRKNILSKSRDFTEGASMQDFIFGEEIAYERQWKVV